MNFARFIAVSSVVLRGHVFNPFWHSRQKRRAVRSEVISQIIPRYFKRYLPSAEAVEEKTEAVEPVEETAAEAV